MTGRLRHTHNNFMQLRKNDAHQYAARHALVHYKSGSIYSFIPKNACSTMRYSLACANGCISESGEFNWIHENNGTFSSSLKDLAKAPYSFTILRCPFARLSSVFLDKFPKRSSMMVEHFKKIDPNLKFDDLTFRNFINYLQKVDVLNVNNHWRPQVDFLVFEEYSDWFSLEKFKHAIPLIEKNTGMVIHDARSVSKHGSDRFDLIQEGAGFCDIPAGEIAAMQDKGCSPSHTVMYEPDLIEKVRKIYRSDIALYREKFGAEDLMF